MPDIGSGVLLNPSTVGSGTGNYESFLRQQANGTEEGFNTDDPQQADNKDGPWTHSIQVGDLKVVMVGGVAYYEIRLDLDEVQSGDKANITLTDLRLFLSSAPADGDDYDNNFADLTNVFDLAGTLNLVDSNHGSGTDDYVLYIPVALLGNNPNAYFTLYASFSGSDDGFEEWRALTNEFTPLPDIGINKQTNGSDDTCSTILVGETVTWTYTVTNNGNLPLTNVVVTDDNGTPGNLLDDFHPSMVVGADMVHNIGDVNNNNILDLTETWFYTASGTATAGEYNNIATVGGSWAFGGATGSVSAFEEDCYYGSTPSIEINKLTNGTDDTCPVILSGATVTWTYFVSNTGDIALTNIAVRDDMGTPGDGSDDLAPDAVLGLGGIYNVGDLNENGILDLTEVWQYILTGTATAGNYLNTAYVTGDATDDSQNTQTVGFNESDCYYGATPAIEITKETNGTDDLCPVLMVGDTVTWTYHVTNTGDIALSNIVVKDDNGTVSTSDDFNPLAILKVGGYNIGDANSNGLLDPNETWEYRATGTVLIGHYVNVATVTGDASDDVGNMTTVNANEDDCYLGLEGFCPRTPGFWQNMRNGGQFWDKVDNNEKNLGQDDFPTGELLYSVDADNNGSLDGRVGLLIGDYNHNGYTDAWEDTIFISYEDARKLINANNKEMSDGVVKIGRDLVATWLNFLAGSPIGDASDDNSPRHFIDQAIEYLQIFGDSNNSNASGYIDLGENFDTYSTSHKKIDTSSIYWNSVFSGGENAGSAIHWALDDYNNTGTINDIVYAPSCDSQQFVNELLGYYWNGVMTLNQHDII